MPLPYPQNLTPDSPPYTTVQINEYWWSVIFGFGDSALIRENWDVTDEQWDEEVLPAIINALDTSMNCDCIKDLTFDPVTGKLTYVDGAENTVEVFNAGDTFTSSNYYVITANEAEADDAYCYAAHLLSEHASDDMQDMLEIVDVLEDATVSVVNEIFASMVDLVPLFGDMGEAYLRITDNLAEAAYDWVKENARDIQARALAAEIFYCGIKLAMENGGQSSLRSSIITAAGENLIEFGLSFIDEIWEIPDLWDVFEDAYTGLDGELLGYGIVAWFLSTDAILDALGADRPLEAIVAHATKHAAAHDSRDCVGFPCSVWEHTFDFTVADGGWEPRGTVDGDDAIWTDGIGWEDVNLDPPSQYNRLCVIDREFDERVLTFVKVIYDYVPGNGFNQEQSALLPFGVLDTGDGVEGTGKILSWTGSGSGHTIRVNIWSDSESPSIGNIIITSVEVHGIGANPFI